jgi:hypothetical protein
MSYELDKGAKKRWFLWPAVLLLIAAVALGAWLHWHNTPKPIAVNTSPVPAAVAQAVNFPIYYPDPQKLPPGYQLDLNSFRSPVKNGAAYTVRYGDGKKMVFSVQAKPSDSELQTFKSSDIPLRIDYQTPLGLAEIGAYHSQTLVSLPVDGGPWIVITAPPDINQDQLKAVLRSLRQ